MDKKKSLISIVVPIYFEEKVINEFYNRTKKVLVDMAHKIEHEFIFVNDGSTDKSLEILQKLSQKDKSVKIINFSRNFGHQIAITAGIDYANGDAVVVMDGDLQDPPEIIPEMVSKWEEGFEVVYGVRTKRKGETLFKLLTADIFYKIMSKLSDVKLPLSAGDFRLMDRKVVDSLKTMREENRYIRGLVSWIGFSQCGLSYERDVRYAGSTKYSLMKMLKFALDGITSFSDKPLLISSYIGILITLVAFLLTVLIIIIRLTNPQSTIQGWTSLIVVILFMGGIQLFSIGIIGQYIGRIYKEIKQRPLYIISNKTGFENEGKNTESIIKPGGSIEP
jgi:polyisoprenyl-phosphate glycosyltransferase